MIMKAAAHHGPPKSLVSIAMTADERSRAGTQVTNLDNVALEATTTSAKKV